MALHSTPVSRCLDKRLKLFGLEIPDVLLVFITLSILVSSDWSEMGYAAFFFSSVRAAYSESSIGLPVWM